MSLRGLRRVFARNWLAVAAVAAVVAVAVAVAVALARQRREGYAPWRTWNFTPPNVGYVYKRLKAWPFPRALGPGTRTAAFVKWVRWTPLGTWPHFVDLVTGQPDPDQIVDPDSGYVIKTDGVTMAESFDDVMPDGSFGHVRLPPGEPVFWPPEARAQLLALAAQRGWTARGLFVAKSVVDTFFRMAGRRQVLTIGLFQNFVPDLTTLPVTLPRKPNGEDVPPMG